ncbi:unnamed protein product [Clavelina lepadiformis]|uniref:Uncharacterized protein n=1 Tax=Clavelina lepadiformis TaxID=159417 RepID=A0ABP0GTU0_CLALP
MDGGKQFNPEQRKLQWCEHVRRETRVTKKAHEDWKKPYGSWLKANDMNKDITYFNNNKQHKKYSEYDRLFHVDYKYEKKLHRDDRINRLNLNVREEEKPKAVPVLSSSVYGAKPQLEKPSREHFNIESVNKGFYRSRGTNIPCSSD